MSDEVKAALVAARDALFVAMRRDNHTDGVLRDGRKEAAAVIAAFHQRLELGARREGVEMAAAQHQEFAIAVEAAAHD